MNYGLMPSMVCWNLLYGTTPGNTGDDMIQTKKCGARIAGICISSGVLSAAAPAYCQSIDANEGSDTQKTASLEEIVVTAERRAETVQTATQSITAVSGAQLQAQGITSVAQLGTEIPGISERNSGPGQTEYEMRGVSSAGGTSPTVGFYLDDVPLTPPAGSTAGKVAIDPNLYDLNRVEVLRGPQGTLYGASSMGGTIRLITNQPNTEAFEGSVQVTGSGTDGGGANGSVSAMLNVPIVEDKLALRIVGTESYTSGWIDRIVLNDFPLPTNGGMSRGNVLAATPSAQYPDSNWERLQGVRASLLWQPQENLTISPTVMYQRINQGAPNFVDQPPGASHEAHYQPFNISEPFADQFELYTLPIKYDIGTIQLDSVTAYYNRTTHLVQDSSEYGQDFLQFFIGAGPVTFAQAGPLRATDKDTTGQFTQEFRISSTGDGSFQWLAGAFYQSYTSTTVEATNTPGAIVTSILGTDSYFNVVAKTTLTQYAGFGEASYKLDDFKLTAGLRYFSYNTGGFQTQWGGLITGTGPEGAQTIPLPSKSSGVDPRINLSYAPSGDLTFYVQAAKGFRPGSAIPPAPVTCTGTPTQYAPDSVWSYEGGEKARLFDQQLTVNAAVYFEDWTGIQQNFTEPCGYSFTTNAGTAHIYGSELETSWRITPELILATGLGYTHARLAAVPTGSGFFVGQLVQAVPEWTDTTSLVYTHQLNRDYNLVFRATDEYVASQQVPTYTLVTLPARNLVNLRIGLSNTQKASVSLFADNVGNVKKAVSELNPISFLIPPLNRAVVNQPRTIGVELNYAFGGR